MRWAYGLFQKKGKNMFQSQSANVLTSRFIRDLGMATGIAAIGTSILMLMHVIDRDKALPIFFVVLAISLAARLIKVR